MALSLLSNASSNLNGNSISFKGGWVGTVYCYGTFNGANVRVQVSPEGNTWFNLANLTFQSANVVNMDLLGFIRGNVSEAISGTDITLIVLDKRG